MSECLVGSEMCIRDRVRPWDIPITKVTFALLFNSVLLLIIVLSVSHWYRKRPQGAKAVSYTHLTLPTICSV